MVKISANHFNTAHLLGLRHRTYLTIQLLSDSPRMCRKLTIQRGGHQPFAVGALPSLSITRFITIFA